MSSRVYLRDIEVLHNLDTELSQFNHGANTVLDSTARDIKASQERLKARMTYWQAELRRRQNEYDACRRRGKDRCHAEAIAVQQAQDALGKLKRLSSRLEQAVGEYLPYASRLQCITRAKIRKAKDDLHRSIRKYQSYLAHQERGSGSVYGGGKSSVPTPQLKFGELQPNAVYKRKGYEYQTDESGKVSFVYAKLRLEQGIRTGHQHEVGKLGLETDEGGHWVGTRFGGSPEGVNLFPQDVSFNRTAYRRMENEWANALRAGKEVEVAIQPVHLGGSDRPIGADVYYMINGKSIFKTFYNEPDEG